MPLLSRSGIGVFAAAFLSLGGPALAAGTQDSPDTAPLYLHRPGPYAGPLASSTTGQLASPTISPLPRHLSIGFNDMGGQLRFHLSPNWAAEARFLMGSSTSDFGTVHALVLGLRGYRFFPERHRWRLYAGMEGDSVKTSLRSVNTSGNPNSVANVSGFGDTSGYAVGGFGGVEFRLFKRVAFDLDIGPYMIGLQEKVTRVSDTTLDFVANAAINVYLF